VSHANENLLISSNLEVGTSNLFVNTANGNVGIGITEPTEKLHVVGNILASGTANCAYDTDTTHYFGRAAIGYSGIDDRAEFAHVDHNNTTGYALRQNNVGDVSINTPTGRGIYFKENDTNQMILADSNVGIGIEEPTEKLHVVGNILATGDIKVNASNGLRARTGIYGSVDTFGNGSSGYDGYSINGTVKFMSNGDIYGLYVESGSGNEWGIRCDYQGSTDLRYTNNVKLSTTNGGVNVTGTISASGALEAAKDSNTTSYLGRAAVGYCGTNDNASFAHIDVNNTTGYAIRQNSVGDTLLNCKSGEFIYFREGDVNKAILRGGNFGIGVDNPTQKLDVAGSIRASVAFLGGTSTDTSRAFSHLSAMGNSTAKYITIGNSNTERDQAELYFFKTASLDTNFMGLALHSKSIMHLTGAGNVGIGITTPDTKLHLKDPPSVTAYGGYRSYIHMQYGAGNWIMAVDNVTTINQNLYWYANLYPSGTISKVITFENDQSKGTVVNQNNFTGQHRTFIKNIPYQFSTDYKGMIVSSDNNKYIKMSGGIANGMEAITINESLPLVSLSNVARDKICFGVISDSEDPNERVDTYGRISSHFVKEEGDTRVYINSVGEGAVWVVNTNGNLESGDYITTSNVAGYGQLQDDDILHNYTVAKITMDCDFNPPQQPVQIILKDEEGNNILDQYGQLQWIDDPSGATEAAYKVKELDGGILAAFVGCTYHCG